MFVEPKVIQWSKGPKRHDIPFPPATTDIFFPFPDENSTISISLI